MEVINASYREWKRKRERGGEGEREREKLIKGDSDQEENDHWKGRKVIENDQNRLISRGGLTIGRVAEGEEQLLDQVSGQFGTEIAVDEGGEALIKNAGGIAG